MTLPSQQKEKFRKDCVLKEYDALTDFSVDPMSADTFIEETIVAATQAERERVRAIAEGARNGILKENAYGEGWHAAFDGILAALDSESKTV